MTCLPGQGHHQVMPPRLQGDSVAGLGIVRIRALQQGLGLAAAAACSTVRLRLLLRPSEADSSRKPPPAAARPG